MPEPRPEHRALGDCRGRRRGGTGGVRVGRERVHRRACVHSYKSGPARHPFITKRHESSPVEVLNSPAHRQIDDTPAPELDTDCFVLDSLTSFLLRMLVHSPRSLVRSARLLWRSHLHQCSYSSPTWTARPRSLFCRCSACNSSPQCSPTWISLPIRLQLLPSARAREAPLFYSSTPAFRLSPLWSVARSRSRTRLSPLVGLSVRPLLCSLSIWTLDGSVLKWLLSYPCHQDRLFCQYSGRMHSCSRDDCSGKRQDACEQHIFKCGASAFVAVDRFARMCSTEFAVEKERKQSASTTAAGWLINFDTACCSCSETFGAIASSLTGYLFQIKAANVIDFLCKWSNFLIVHY